MAEIHAVFAEEQAAAPGRDVLLGAHELRTLHIDLRLCQGTRTHDGEQRKTLLLPEIHIGRREEEPFQIHFLRLCCRTELVVVALGIIEERTGLYCYDECFGRDVLDETA